jgi:hypothetical protein
VSDLRARLDDFGVNRVGAAVAGVGAFLVLLAFTIFDWFRDGNGFFAGAGSHSTFSQVRDQLDAVAAQAAAEHISGHVSFGASRAYFSWLGWVLLLAALVAVAFAVSSPGRDHWTIRWLAAVVAASGIAITFLALNLITVEGNASNNANAPTYGQFLSHTGFGAWAAIVGFVLILVAGLLPHRAV